MTGFGGGRSFENTPTHFLLSFFYLEQSDESLSEGLFAFAPMQEFPRFQTEEQEGAP